MAEFKGALIPKTDLRKLYARLQGVKRDEIVSNIITRLSYIGEKCVKIARERGDYFDQTGNLRSSIGYIVLYDGKVMMGGDFQATQVAPGYREVQRTRKCKDGSIVTYTAKVKVGGSGADGMREGKALLDKLKAKFPYGVALIVCAGMNYASYVENVHHKHVLIDAELLAEQLVKQLKDDLNS